MMGAAEGEAMAVTGDEQDRMARAREKFFAALLTGSIRQLVIAATEELGNPIMVADQAYRIVARSEDRGQVHNYWRRVVNSSECNYDDYFDNRDAIHRAFVESMPVVNRTSSPDGAIIETRIGSSDNILGFLAVFECDRPFVDSDASVAQLLSRCLALLMNRGDKETERPVEREALMLYRRAMQKDSPNQSAEAQLAETIGVRSSPCYVIIKLCSVDEGTAELPSRLARNRLESLLGNCKTWKTRSHVVALMGYDKEGPYESADAQGALDRMLAQNNLCAGLSYPFFDLGDLRHASYQAGRALSIGRDTTGISKSYRYGDVVNADVSEMVSERCDIADIVDPRLIKILRYDVAHQTDYLCSISEMVNHKDNVSQACRSLNVHRNTLLYRLDRIRDLFSLDVRNPSEHTSLVLDLSILRFHARGSFNDEGLKLLAKKLEK